MSTASFHQTYVHFGLNPLNFDTHKIEQIPLDDFLHFLHRDLVNDSKALMSKIEACREVDDAIKAIIKMVHTLDAFQTHLEFNIAILKTQNAEEIEAVKEKFGRVGKAHDRIKQRDDIAIIPIKHFLAIIHDKMFLEFRKFLNKSFRTCEFREVEFVKSYENLAKITILTNRFELADLHYPDILAFPKDDIFCIPKTSPLWQDIYQAATFKQVLTAEEAKSSFKQLHFILRIAHIVNHKLADLQENSQFGFLSTVLSNSLYYGTQQTKAEVETLLRFVNPTLNTAFRVWNLTEHPLVSKGLELITPRVGYDDRIFIPRLFPQITKQVILQEYESKTINKIQPMDISEFQALDLSSIRTETLKELFTPEKEKIPIRILSPDFLAINPNESSFWKKTASMATTFLKNTFSAKMKKKEQEGTIVVHIHGGGFVSMSSATHRVYLNRWVNELQLVHFSIDYRLAPENQYPDALDDVWQAYFWIINYAESVLGIKNMKIILTGDSAGGNLCVALMLRLAKAGFPTPSGCLLLYPCLYVDEMSCSPSYLTSIEDPMLPSSLLKLVAKAYVGEGFKKNEDPFISPLVASDELLQKMPPIRIISGTEDPLFDDNWRFISRLKKLEKDVKIIVYKYLPHAFFCHFDLKNYSVFIKESIEILRELISLNDPNVDKIE